MLTMGSAKNAQISILPPFSEIRFYYITHVVLLPQLPKCSIPTSTLCVCV